MQKSVQHLATLSVAAALSIGALVGCDTSVSQADKEVARQVADGNDRHDPTGKASVPIFEKAAGQTGASAATRANAKASLAGAELEAANTIIAQITEDRNEMARLVWEISELGNQVRSSNLLITTYKKHDPAETKQAIEQKISEAQGGEGKDAWITNDKATIPTLSAVTQTISTKEGEIAKKQEEIKTLTDQRAKAIEDSEKALRASESAKGQASVDQFKQSADLRKQATDLGVQIESAQAATVPLKHDLEIAQGQKKALDDAIAAFQDQTKTIDAGWKAIGDQIDAQQTLSKTLASAEGDAPVASTNPAVVSEGNSIVSKSARLADISKECDERFATAEQNLNNAIKHFGEAKTDAEMLAKELRTRRDALAGAPELLKTIKTMEDAYSPAIFGLQQATAQNTLATLYACRAKTLQLKQEVAAALSPILKEGNSKLPAGLDDPELEKSLTDARKLADDTYAAADAAMVTIAEAPNATQDRKTAAQVGRIFTLYGWAQLARDMGQGRLVDQRIADAVTSRDAALSNNAVLPVLPVELAPPPVAPAPAPTTAPATAPTSAPAAAQPAARATKGSELFGATN